MAGAVESKLNALAITLKEPANPIANYVPYVRTGNLLTVSGQLCFGGDGKLVATGQLGAGVSINFAGSLVVQSSTPEAMTSGQLNFSGTSVLVAQAASAVDGAAITLLNSAQIQIYAPGATTAASSLTFNNTQGGTGGTLDLRGDNTSFGAINSTGTGAGVITNSGSTSATLT